MPRNQSGRFTGFSGNGRIGNPGILRGFLGPRYPPDMGGLSVTVHPVYSMITGFTGDEELVNDGRPVGSR